MSGAQHGASLPLSTGEFPRGERGPGEPLHAKSLKPMGWGGFLASLKDYLPGNSLELVALHLGFLGNGYQRKPGPAYQGRKGLESACPWLSPSIHPSSMPTHSTFMPLFLGSWWEVVQVHLDGDRG